MHMPARAGMSTYNCEETGKMDNFHFLDVKSSIDRKETASIKDAIFRRAREKASSLAEEKSENYTSQVQDDVMNIARESLQASPMNPFNQFMENVGVQKAPKIVEQVKPQEKKEEPVKELKRNIESVSDSAFVKSVKDETMTAARNQFRQGTNLNSILNFLNTQAAIKMAENAHSKINHKFV